MNKERFLKRQVTSLAEEPAGRVEGSRIGMRCPRTQPGAGVHAEVWDGEERQESRGRWGSRGGRSQSWKEGRAHKN